MRWDYTPSEMSADGGDGSGMQFDRVDLATPGEAGACRSCKRPLGEEYFEIAHNVICSNCAAALSGSKQGRGSLARALAFGAGAALLGAIAWYAITKISGYQLGLVAIVVGLFVGRAVRKGGGGLGGWKYQALAMVLTYVSITSSYVPLVLTNLTAPSTATDDSTGAANGAVAKSKPSTGQLLLVIGAVIGLALAAPFLGGTSNFMGFIIIGIGLYEAWKINRRVPLSGPFRFGPAAAGPGGGPPPTALP